MKHKTTSDTSLTTPVLTLVPEVTDPDEQCQLGDMYFFGKGVPQNMAVGVSWYMRAARQGHAEAQSSLGFCYQHGAGVFRNVHEAIHCYKQADQQNEPFAAYYLALMYEKGDGVPQDIPQACRWYERAVEVGHKEAALRRTELLLRYKNVVPLSVRNNK